MSMNSPEMFRLLEDIPKGAEAMITRVLHSVTEKGTFKDLYFSFFFFSIII